MTDHFSLPVLLDALEKTARGMAREDVPALVGDLERVKTIAWARLAAPHPQEQAGQDALLTAEDVSGQTQLSAAWLYRHADALPFTRRIGRKVLFSQLGLNKWLEQRRP